MYDRSTCLYEALVTGKKISKKGADKNTVIISESIHPNDLEVVMTLAAHTQMNIVTCPLDNKNA